ncbi:hypothetical protein BCD48_39665 [Pseudofrankia sp. BMG5.36]|nr:hypothetical protein BCD48_39665 [Pseudofrankia sp. BMG5.36]
MAKNQLGAASWYTEILQERRQAVPKIMKPDASNVMLLAEPLESSHEGRRLEWPATLGAEHERLGVRSPLPLRPDRLADLHLSLSVLHQRLPHKAQQRQSSLAGFRLDRPDVKASLHSLELLAHVQYVIGEVDVAPTQSQHFAASQAAQQ